MLKYLLSGTFVRICREGDAGGDNGGGGAGPGGANGNPGAAAKAGDIVTGTAKPDPAAGGTPAPAMNVPWLPQATAEDAAYVAAKGWDRAANPAEEILKSYRNLEKLNGNLANGKAVVIPDDTADDTTRDQFYSRLGRPEKAEGYTAKEVAGLDADQYKTFTDIAHKAGLTDKQVSALKAWNDELGKKVEADLQAKAQVENAQQIAALKSEWGAAHDQNLQLAKEAATRLGISEAQLNGMQMGLGYDGTLKLMAKLGKATGEDTTDINGRAGAGAGAMAPDAAQKELSRLSTDKEFLAAWTDKMHPRHKEMVDRKSQLSAWAAAK